MNWNNTPLYSAFMITMAVLFTACDSFEEDMQPEGDELMTLRKHITALPGTSLYIDLTKSLKSSEAVSVQISKTPSLGTASIQNDAILHYVPRPEFTSGTDYVSLDVLNVAGEVLDNDLLYINMVQSEDSLPCFNGALADHYTTQKGHPVEILPLGNDGYCADEASGAAIEFLTQPTHGSLEQVGLFTYSYTPNPDFVGQDAFMYELELISGANSSFSLAKITIEVKDGISYEGCDSLVYPMYHELNKPLQDFYLFAPLNAHPVCEVDQWTVDSLYVEHGDAVVTQDGLIKYFPGGEPEDHISYTVIFDGQAHDNYIEVKINGGNSEGCPEAFDDEYYLQVVGDSVGVSNEPHILDPVQNDRYCTDDYTIRILEEPSIGEAVVIDQQIQYYSDEEFAGIRETQMRYEICEAKCDSAYIYLTVDKTN